MNVKKQMERSLRQLELIDFSSLKTEDILRLAKAQAILAASIEIINQDEEDK